MRVDRFKIHQSVFDRIGETNADYAPLGIPVDYDVVCETPDKSGTWEATIKSADAAQYESAEQRKRRLETQSGIKRTVTRRKAVYYVMTGIAVVMAGVPFVTPPVSAVAPDGFPGSLVTLIPWAVTFVPLPGAARIGDYWTHHPNVLLVLVAAYGLFYLLSVRLARATRNQSQKAWTHLDESRSEELNSR